MSHSLWRSRRALTRTGKRIRQASFIRPPDPGNVGSQGASSPLGTGDSRPTEPARIPEQGSGSRRRALAILVWTCPAAPAESASPSAKPLGRRRADATGRGEAGRGAGA